MPTAKIKSTSHEASRAVLSRIYDRCGVVFSQNGEAVTGSALTARIVLDEGYEDVRPDEQKEFRRTVEIYSSYYSNHTLQKLAEEVKGWGEVIAE